MQPSDSSSSRFFPDRNGAMSAPSCSSTYATGTNLEYPEMLSATQLPTPQTHSPSTLINYFPGVAGSPESPLAYTHTRGLGGLQTTSLAPRIQPRSASPSHEPRRSPSRPPQTATPETSPASSSKRSVVPINMTRRPSSAPLLSTKGSFNVKSESPPLGPLAPAHIISPSVSVYSKSRSPELSTTRSNLSSPFVEKLRLPDEQATFVPVQTPQQATELLTPQPKPSLANAANLFSPVHLSERRPASTQSDVPTPPPLVSLTGLAVVDGEIERKPGGEIDRIRANVLALQQEHETDLESRRPDFLKRIKRSNDELTNGSEMDASSSGLGIRASPVKGRRLQLFDAFQQTSEQSFEESLMTNGYGMFGEPRTPKRQSHPREEPSKVAMKWLEQSTPAGPSSSPLISDTDVKLSEKEAKKRKRLEAFTTSASRSRAKLLPTDIEGIGRILVPSEDVEKLRNSTPVKKKAAGKKKKGKLASPANIDKKGKSAVRPVEELDEPSWPDNEFPWALRGKEREVERNAFTEEKLKWIERYFSRESDTDDSEGEPNDEELLPSSTWGQEYEDPPVATRRGRGKAVPLQPNPATARTPSERNSVSPLSMRKNKSVFFQTDPADARAALMSRRSVRMFSQRRARRTASSRDMRIDIDDGIFACACGRSGHGDDGKPAVECSQCKFWYHFDCIGIADEDELGEEEDTWFCSDACREAFIASNAPEPDPLSPRVAHQPTFVPTDERPLPSLARGDVPLYSSSPQRPWGSSSAFETPIHSGSHRNRDAETYRRSIWDDASFRTPVGPSTPLSGSRNIRVTTPGAKYDSLGIAHDDISFGHFDPMSTPSRSLRLTPGLFATPKQLHPASTTVHGQATYPGSHGMVNTGLSGPSWASRAGGMFATPTQRMRNGLSAPGSTGLSTFGFVVSGEDGILGRGHPGPAMYGADDTPIRRAPDTREPLRSSLMSSYMPTTPTQSKIRAPESPSPPTRSGASTLTAKTRDGPRRT